MGYFSNGTEGDMYENGICSKCWHYWFNNDGTPRPLDEHCPVLTLHAVYNYDQRLGDEATENPEGADALAVVLGTLIGRNKTRPLNKVCSMFMPLDRPDIPGQGKLFGHKE